MITFYKYVKATTLKKILESNKMRLTNIDELNDLFELAYFENDEWISLNNIAVLCLTRSNLKRLMWAHYGDSFKGACIGITINENILYPVCYSSKKISSKNYKEVLKDNKMIPIKSMKKDYPDYGINTIAFYKHAQWFYEKEYRIVSKLNDYESCFSKDDNHLFIEVKIQEITIGINYDKNTDDVLTLDDLKKECRNRSIVLKEISRDNKKFKLKSKKIIL